MQHLKTEAAMMAAVAKLKETEERERKKLMDMPQKQFNEICRDVGVEKGSRRSQVEQLLRKMIFCR